MITLQDVLTPTVIWKWTLPLTEARASSALRDLFLLKVVYIHSSQVKTTNVDTTTVCLIKECK